MLRVLSMVSGGGTNLQAIIDSVKNGMITNTELVGVISNNKNAYALTRAKENGIDAKCISPKDYESREVFNQELLKAVDRRLSKPHHQYSSISDSIFLRNRLLWIEST